MHRRNVVIALAGLAASGVAYALSRMNRRRRAGAHDRPPEEIQAYTCACGQVFRMTGAGRHRVYWLAEAAENDPILGHQCPSCDRELPRDQDVTLTATGVGEAGIG